MIKNRALSLVEVIVVIAIICTLVAVIIPVILRAKNEGYKSKAVLHLKTLYQAIELYRLDQDGHQDAGTASAMGLPPFEAAYGTPPLQLKGFSTNPWRSGCASHPRALRPNGSNLDYLPDDVMGSWDVDVNRHGSQATLVRDLNCNVFSENIESPRKPIVKIVLKLDGSVHRKVTLRPLEDY